MKKSIEDIIGDHQSEVNFHTDRTRATYGEPQLSSSPVIFEIGERTNGVSNSGVALIHQIVVQMGLPASLNSVPVLAIHLPYYESDHLLNITYNFFVRRHGVGAHRISSQRSELSWYARHAFDS
ncbi:MAG: hypothetical protein LBQ50_00935 [Planctomycetaceae bacterium]|nr:hypothetical protein [Planctomycetaceae bacterium]